MGKTSKGNVSVLEDDSLDQSKKLCLVEPYLKQAPFEEFCGDIVMGSDTPSIGHTKPICTKLLDSTPVSSLLLPATLLCACISLLPRVTLEVIIPPLIHIVHT